MKHEKRCIFDERACEVIRRRVMDVEKAHVVKTKDETLKPPPTKLARKACFWQ